MARKHNRVEIEVCSGRHHPIAPSDLQALLRGRDSGQASPAKPMSDEDRKAIDSFLEVDGG